MQFLHPTNSSNNGMEFIFGTDTQSNELSVCLCVWLGDLIKSLLHNQLLTWQVDVSCAIFFIVNFVNSLVSVTVIVLAKYVRGLFYCTNIALERCICYGNSESLARWRAAWKRQNHQNVLRRGAHHCGVSRQKSGKIRDEDTLIGGIKRRRSMKNVRFSTNIWLYLGYRTLIESHIWSIKEYVALPMTWNDSLKFTSATKNL